MIVKKRLTFFDKLILALNCAAVVAMLLSYLAPVADPRKYWPIAFFGLAYPFILIATLIFIPYWWMRKRTRWALLSVITILIGWGILNNNIGLRFPSKLTLRDSNTIRVMNYNVHGFRKPGLEDYKVVTRHDAFQLIAHEKPTIFCSEEFYSRRRGRFATVDSIKKILGADYAYFATFPADRKEGVGMGIISVYPIINTGVIKLTGDYDINQCIWADMKKGTQTFRVYAVHLQSIHLEFEDYDYIKDVSRGKTDMQNSRRIGSKLKHAFEERARQVMLVRESMDACPYPFLIAGDFNDTPSSFAVNQMAKGLKNAFREKGSGLGRTYNGNFPNYQIDYIMASKQFDVLTYGVIRKKLSDHYPVYSDLVLRP
ncbi:endonuclease/exonuclease/phosphatase family metal-dependent hydrolase [Mucilaginibacter yixingensis]|uniref:Endonuclease/exonuclease/phosphatase family metal-dependent hydrolase n=1 Tax=Mucilaginibacter yixingensis TaxID=1295612 RepID=A0A2T5J8V1_9SPHI|nr:endonuclease/exonuclease/phosphatase family protein [Mucilaginibacter yixingensis]PTQ95885.1 endonuclease/exonuclease/phosphatase family metal-dependent hydrolase [Mucilaginibacter yixingensis]